MEKFALIGKTLKHSYSKKIHAKLGDYVYDLCEILPENVGDFVKNGGYKGFNVTIPYKKEVIPFLDEIDERAKNIGAVNTVVLRGDKRFGFNTDFNGMLYALNRAGISLKNKSVLILGSGGTSNTAKAVAESESAKDIKILSRTGEINYDNYKTRAKDANVIINTTPVGMYPNNYECLVDLSAFDKLEGVFDAVYNPAITKLLYQAKVLGVPHSNGLPMLVAQAKYAAELFLDKKIDDQIIEKIIHDLQKESLNVVLVGMPGCGKSTVGKEVAKFIGKEFIDTDALIVEREKREIPEIFATEGEEYFREVESEVLNDVGKLSGKVISTGGGVVKNRENYFALKQNAVVIWLDRAIELLVCEGRPLSKDKATLERLYEQRKDNYAYFADKKIFNDGEIEKAVKGVVDAYENFSY